MDCMDISKPVYIEVKEINTSSRITPIHPFMNLHLSEFGSQGQLPKQKGPDVPVYGHLLQLLQLLQGNTKVLPGQPRDIIPPACPGCTLGPPPSWTYLKHQPGQASRKHPNHIPKLPRLAPLHVAQQRLYPQFMMMIRA